jgi:hypothetical protein
LSMGSEKNVFNIFEELSIATNACNLLHLHRL